ncbi:MAG TPA: hypothetical protein VF444_03220 [Pseudonocardiaceae bacterium]
MTSADPAAESTDPTDSIAAGLTAAIGIGVFAALAPTALLSGRYLLVAAVAAGAIATVIAVFARPLGRVVGSRIGRTRGQAADEASHGTITLAADIIWLLARLAVLAALADSFGAYAMPTHPLLAALCVLVFVTAADALRLRPPTALLVVGLVVMFIALGALVAVCVAISAPPSTGVPVPTGIPGSVGLSGVLPATGVMLVAFAEPAGPERVTRGRRRLIVPLVSLAGFLAVAWAVLYQLGPERLAVSPAPLRDALGAADASELRPLLFVGALVASVLALLIVFWDVRRTGRRIIGRGRPGASVFRSAGRSPEQASGWRTVTTAVLIGAVAAVLAWALGPVAAMGIAASFVVVRYILMALSAALRHQPGGTVGR